MDNYSSYSSYSWMLQDINVLKEDRNGCRD